MLISLDLSLEPTLTETITTSITIIIITDIIFRRDLFFLTYTGSSGLLTDQHLLGRAIGTRSSYGVVNAAVAETLLIHSV